MSLTKQEVAPSQYMDDTKTIKASKGTGKRTAIKLANQLGTPTLLWLIVRRHKVSLLAIGNIILVLNFALPEWPQMVLGLIGK